MPRIRTTETAALVAVQGRHPPLSHAAVVGAVRWVLVGERRRASISLTFVGRARMRELNRRWRGADRATDVLAFALTGPAGVLTGDIYLCRAIAAREAAARRLPLRQELLRLVVHGTLHVLGYDHPEGDDRTTSAMWRCQERYLRGLA